jgi:hypothetical protein
VASQQANSTVVLDNTEKNLRLRFRTTFLYVHSNKYRHIRNPERGEDRYGRRYGRQVDLKTSVARARDDVVIAEGEHSIYIPDYLHM